MSEHGVSPGVSASASPLQAPFTTQSHPHLVDAILAALISSLATTASSSPLSPARPPSARRDRRKLLSLRSLNSTTRARVDAALAHRLVLSGPPRHPAFLDVTAENVMGRMWEAVLRRSCGWDADGGNEEGEDGEGAEREGKERDTSDTIVDTPDGPDIPHDIDHANSPITDVRAASRTRRRRRSSPEPWTRVLRRRGPTSGAAADGAGPSELPLPSSPPKTVNPRVSPTQDAGDRHKEGRQRHARAFAYTQSLLHHTRVLDVEAKPDFHVMPSKTSAAIHFAAFPNLCVLRLLRDAKPPLVPPVPLASSPIPAPSAPLPPTVCFRTLGPTPFGTPAHYRVGPIPASRLVWSVSFNPDTLDSPSWVEPFFAADETREFVYLFVRRPGRALRVRSSGRAVRSRTEYFRWGDYLAPSGALGVLEDIVYHMGPELERPHVIAGLEGMPPQAMGLTEGAGKEEVFAAVRAGIRAALVARRDNVVDRVVHPDLWEDEEVDARVARVRIITLDEYREDVGEEQFAWETQEEV